MDSWSAAAPPPDTAPDPADGYFDAAPASDADVALNSIQQAALARLRAERADEAQQQAQKLARKKLFKVRGIALPNAGSKRKKDRYHAIKRTMRKLCANAEIKPTEFATWKLLRVDRFASSPSFCCRTPLQNH